MAKYLVKQSPENIRKKESISDESADLKKDISKLATFEKILQEKDKIRNKLVGVQIFIQ